MLYILQYQFKSNPKNYDRLKFGTFGVKRLAYDDFLYVTVLPFFSLFFLVFLFVFWFGVCVWVRVFGLVEKKRKKRKENRKKRAEKRRKGKEKEKGRERGERGEGSINRKSYFHTNLYESRIHKDSFGFFHSVDHPLTCILLLYM